MDLPAPEASKENRYMCFFDIVEGFYKCCHLLAHLKDNGKYRIHFGPGWCQLLNAEKLQLHGTKTSLKC